MGVWIETFVPVEVNSVLLVTPYVGVWIETSYVASYVNSLSHTLRGCVDWNIDW